MLPPFFPSLFLGYFCLYVRRNRGALLAADSLAATVGNGGSAIYASAFFRSLLFVVLFQLPLLIFLVYAVFCTLLAVPCARVAFGYVGVAGQTGALLWLFVGLAPFVLVALALPPYVLRALFAMHCGPAAA